MADPLDAARGLMRYIDSSPSPYHAISVASSLLESAGFVPRDETAAWVGDAVGRFYVTRGGALVAWAVGADAAAHGGWRIIGAHSDSPNLRVKPHPDTGIAGWRQVAIEVYGGVLNNSWLDRDLGLSGRVLLSSGEFRLLNVDRPLLRVAQLAIHLDRDVNERGLVLDRQAHLTPIWGLGIAREGDLREFVAGGLGVPPAEVVDFDLMTHDLTPAALLGVDGDLLASGRLDNLCSCYAAVRAITARPDDGPPMAIALFDHEEVGSDSTTGAGGPFLEHVLRRSVAARGGREDEFARSMAASVCVSADMAHSVHPNYLDRYEPGHRLLPNAGPAVKRNVNQRYATDAATAALFASACDRAGVPHQTFVSRNNVACGSTIGPITATRLGIATVDVGCPQLSMHSARELMGANDVGYLTSALTEFLSS
jgi:aspartyl aminopeptidase